MNILQKNNSIRFKIILLILMGTLALIFVIYAVSMLVISKSYLKIEKDDTTQNIQRVTNAIDELTDRLTISVADWAFWDDTYQFVQDGNKDYIEANLGNTSISNLKINSMVFVNTKNEIVFKKMIEIENVQEVSSESIGSYVASHKKLTTYEDTKGSVHGLIMLPEGLSFIASRPILTSDAEGPIQGSIVFSKFLDDSVIQSVQKTTDISFKIYNLNSMILPDDVISAKSYLDNGNAYFIDPVSRDLVAGYTILNDLDGDPLAIIKIDISRTLFNQGESTLRIFMATTGVLIILLGIILLFFIERIVVSRLILLSKEVEKISLTGNLLFKVKEGAKDEVGILAAAINQMLEVLDISKKTEREALKNIKKVETDLRSHLQDTERLNQLMVDRELKMIELKKEIEELKNKK